MQNNLRVFITNLGKYNEGELVGKWIDLPAYDDQEIVEALESIDVKNGTRYEEYFITDYELPFQIEEYTNVFKLNETLSNMPLEDIEFLNNPTIEQARAIVFNYSFEEPAELIEDDQIDNMIISEMERGSNWASVKIMLQGIKDINANWYVVDAYGNVQDFTDEDEESYIKDVIELLMNEY